MRAELLLLLFLSTTLLMTGCVKEEITKAKGVEKESKALEKVGIGEEELQIDDVEIYPEDVNVSDLEALEFP